MAKAALTLRYDAPQATNVLESATLQTDIISCCTLSLTSLIKGAWVQQGTHIDLIGAFKPEMRERVLSEAGDIVQTIREWFLRRFRYKSGFVELAGGHHAGRRSDDEITVFKSVGAA